MVYDGDTISQKIVFETEREINHDPATPFLDVPASIRSASRDRQSSIPFPRVENSSRGRFIRSPLGDTCARGGALLLSAREKSSLRAPAIIYLAGAVHNARARIPTPGNYRDNFIGARRARLGSVPAQLRAAGATNRKLHRAKSKLLAVPLFFRQLYIISVTI